MERTKWDYTFERVPIGIGGCWLLLKKILGMEVLLRMMINAAIIGEGPYGLSVAAHFPRHAIPFRIFGRPMDSWLAHRPKGVLLKSDGLALNIFDPGNEFPLRKFCAGQGIDYSDMQPQAVSGRLFNSPSTQAMPLKFLRES